MVMTKSSGCNVDKVNTMLTKHIPEAKMESMYQWKCFLSEACCKKHNYSKCVRHADLSDPAHYDVFIQYENIN